jgi:hypothetical protein
MDPFSQIDDVSGLSHRLEGLVREMSLKTRPTLEHVYALLAYAQQPGVREKFDARFGLGSADAILAKAAQADAVTSLKQAVDVLNAQVAELPALSGRLDALAEAIQSVREPDLSPLLERLDDVSRAVREGAETPEADEGDDDSATAQALAGLTAAVNEMVRLQKAKKTVLRDMNDNVIGLKIED